MVRSGFSEFSYGYALTEQLITASGIPLKVAPIFPSLVAEGRVGGGWDLQLNFKGMALFLQFKLTDCMVRRTAIECKQKNLNPPFYRMHLRSKKVSPQHDLLLALEKRLRTKRLGKVFYAAPLFFKNATFNRHYLAQQIPAQTRFIAPSAIGLWEDEEPHHVSFDSKSSPLVFCTGAPRSLGRPPLDLDGMFRALVGVSSRDRPWPGLAHELIHTLRSVMSAFDIDEPPDAGLLDERSQVAPLETLSYLSRVFFEAQPIFLLPKVEGPPNLD